MNNTTRAKLVFYFLLVISILFPLLVYHKLPFRVASHFNINNVADSWMPRQSYFIVHYGMILVFAIIFGGMAAFAHKIPPSLMNLPNKVYWLTEERKEKTYNTLRSLLYWIGSICYLLFLFLFYQIYKANTNGTEKIDSYSWIAVIIFLVVNGVIIIKYIFYFNKIQRNKEEN